MRSCTVQHIKTHGLTFPRKLHSFPPECSQESFICDLYPHPTHCLHQTKIGITIIIIITHRSRISILRKPLQTRFPQRFMSVWICPAQFDRYLFRTVLQMCHPNHSSHTQDGVFEFFSRIERPRLERLKMNCPESATRFTRRLSVHRFRVQTLTRASSAITLNLRDFTLNDFFNGVISWSHNWKTKHKLYLHMHECCLKNFDKVHRHTSTWKKGWSRASFTVSRFFGSSTNNLVMRSFGESEILNDSLGGSFS